MTRLLAIDPGSTRSATVRLVRGKPESWAWEDNEQILRNIQYGHKPYSAMVIEKVASYGMAVGESVFETVRWAGRFEERCAVEVIRIPRIDVKIALCHDSRANDTNIRLAIIDHYGGDEKAIGGKRCQACKGKGLRGRGKARGPCADCEGILNAVASTVPGLNQPRKGNGLETPRGPLHAFAKDGSGGLGHRWSALAVGLTWLAKEVE